LVATPIELIDPLGVVNVDVEVVDDVVLDVLVVDVVVDELDVEDVVDVVVEVDFVVEVLVELEDVVVLEVEDEVLLDDEPVLDAVYVPLLKVREYVVMDVAEWSPGLENSPTANPISIVEPTPRVGKSYGEAPESLNGL
jgi:hypothetical protein